MSTTDLGVFFWNGEVAGSSSGVTSLNGLAGALILTSTSATVSITPSGKNIDIEVTNPFVSTTVGTIDTEATPSANGATITSNVLYMQSASVSVPGLINTTTQTIAGSKTFSATPTFSTMTSGSVLYAGTAGVLSQDNANFNYASPGQLTIGSVAQGFPLYVYAPSTTGIVLNGAGKTAFSFSLAGNTQFFMATVGASDDWTPGTVAGDLVFRMPNTNQKVNFSLDGGNNTQYTLSKSAFTLGASSVVSGTIIFNNATNANAITLQSLIPTGSYNFNLPNSAGSSGNVLISGGGGSTANSWIGTTGSGNAVLATGPTLTNPVVGTQSQLDGSTKAASTSYVDTAVANAVAGINPAISVNAATTAAGNTSAWTYSNGASGVGATFTGPTNTAIVIDGFTFTTITTQRLLIKNDTQSPSGAFNGIYVLTTLQTGITGAIFTRSLDYDTPSDINNTGAIPVLSGTVNGTTQWVQTSNIVAVGTTPLTFTQFSGNPATYLLAANNLSDVTTKATAFNNLSPMTTGGDLIYGGASGTGTRLANGSANQVLTSNGTTTAPTWNTPTVYNSYSANNHGVVLSGTSTTMTVIAPVSLTTKVLTNGGTGADPTWNYPSYNYTAQTGTYSAVINDYINCTSGTFTVTLPTAVSCAGQSIKVKNTGTGVITIATTSSQTIDGLASGIVIMNGGGSTKDCITFMSDGANWEMTNVKWLVGFSADTSTTAATTSAPFKYTNVTVNPQTGYSSSTGLFTATVPGVYQIGWAAYVGGAVAANLYQNGSNVAQGQEGSSASPSTGYVTRLLAASDTLEIRPDANQTASSGAILNRFSAYKIS